jgi:seryl-tRNA(Sec) selenium transferase
LSARNRYRLDPVVNARGTYTPLGVSRSSQKVREAVDEALSRFYVMDELQDAASRLIADMTGAEAGAVVHCTAAGITLAVAACMTGASAENIAALPSTTGMPFSRVELRVEPDRRGCPSAAEIAHELAAGTPSVWVMPDKVAEGILVLELVPLDDDEIEAVLGRLTEIVTT